MISIHILKVTIFVPLPNFLSVFLCLLSAFDKGLSQRVHVLFLLSNLQSYPVLQAGNLAIMAPETLYKWKREHIVCAEKILPNFILVLLHSFVPIFHHL